MESNDSKEDEPGSFTKIFGIKNSNKEKNTQICDMLKKFQEKDLGQNKKVSIIENALQLENLTVDEIMVHRIDLKAVEKNSSFEDVLNLYVKTKHRKILVYENDIDKIIGIINVNIIMKHYLEKNYKDEKIEKYIQKLMFVPETMKCIKLLDQFKSEKESVAVVVDEYGGTSGLVSFSDIKNFVFKSFDEMSNKKESGMIELKDSTIILNGTANLKEVSDYLKIPIKRNENFDTIGGFLVNFLGKIPEKNEHPTIEYEGVKFKILSVDKQHIDKVQVLK